MKTFTATIDQKYEVWQRHDIKFEAENEQQAMEMIERWQGVPKHGEVEYINTETLSETEEAMSIDDNDGQPVHEIVELVEDTDDYQPTITALGEE